MYPTTIINIDMRFLDTPIIYIGLFILFLWHPSTKVVIEIRFFINNQFCC